MLTTACWQIRPSLASHWQNGFRVAGRECHDERGGASNNFERIQFLPVKDRVRGRIYSIYNIQGLEFCAVGLRIDRCCACSLRASKAPSGHDIA